MKSYNLKIDPQTTEQFLEVYYRGEQLLYNPLLNKGSAFTEEERLNLGLTGFLRSSVSDINAQRKRSYEMYRRSQDDMDKYSFLQSLLNRNETLFYNLLSHHLEEMLPIVYTPTVGTACQMLSHITKDFRGIYINPDNISNIDQLFEDTPLPLINLIVATDGERILGLGDLGSDGMGIPIGKINLYVAAGGVNPGCCLPVTLDVGTNNENLLNDPLYMGYRKRRLEGQAYDDFIERFVVGICRNFPNALLQWEDFAKHKAFKLLERYHNRILSFNDDIQGTGAAVAAALMTGMRIKKQGFRDQRFVIVGMGQAGSGIATSILSILMEEGISKEEAHSKIFCCDFPGLLMEDTPKLEEAQIAFAQKRSAVAQWKLSNPNNITLLDVVKNSKASVLIGVTATTGLFNSEILTLMAKNDERPIIFALSNPTSKSECTSEQVARATHGRGLFAAGSPFAPVDYEGRKIYTSQCNNMFIFPGMGLGALVSRATKITHKMFIAASKAVSAFVTDEQCKQNMLLPDLCNIRQVSLKVAKAISIEARDSGLARRLSDDEFETILTKAQWRPEYHSYRPGPGVSQSTYIRK